MFTGIIETTGKIIDIREEASNKHFVVATSIAEECYIDQSIAHNGICLTIVEKTSNSYTVTAIKETLEKSNLGSLVAGNLLNLERAMLPSSRMDGHIVQGHVDGVASCVKVDNLNGSWEYRFKIDESSSHLIVDKGSITINGVSLTVCDVDRSEFSVNIIPYTYEHTNFKELHSGDTVNIEFDIIGKYVSKYLANIPSIG